MKKVLIGVILGILISTLTNPLITKADNPIKLIINTVEVKCSTPPQMINNRVMVSARDVAENLNAKVEWNPALNGVVITSDKQIAPEELKKQGEVYKNQNNSNNQTNLQNTSEQTQTNPAIETKNTPERKKIYKLESIGETTYGNIDNGYKQAFITITYTNLTDKYIPMRNPIPAFDNDDTRNIKGSGIWTNNNYIRNEAPKWVFKDGYMPPHETATLIYTSRILETTKIINWTFDEYE